MFRRLPSTFLVYWICTSAVAAAAEDVVYLLPEGQEHGRLAVEGEIVDYTGQAITIARPSGQPRRYAAGRVLKIEIEWGDAQEAGRRALAEHDFAAAARHLAEANRVERRVWVRRLILADLMRAYEALGRMEQAGELFLVLVQSDPSTPAFADAPLAWFADDRVGRAQAEAWLNTGDQPAAVLLGASYLLSTTAAPAARQSLVGLLEHPDPRIATLAEAQLWRADLLRATAADAKRWATRIEQMADPLQSGPYFVLGQTRERLDRADDAALAYLRVPVLFPERRELAARALVAAGRTMRRAGHADEATRMWNEVLANYPDTPSQAEAQQLLRSSP